MNLPLIEIKPADRGELLYIPANSEMLAVARLYLEKYAELKDADRILYREILTTFSAGRNAFIENAKLGEKTE
jgi:hypothetical protein